MKTLLLVTLVGLQLISGIALAEKKSPLRQPRYEGGSPTMTREDWVYNFKILASTGLCKEKRYGFKLMYNGEDKDCPEVVSKLIDKCLKGPLDKEIPKVMKGTPVGTKAGKAMGACILVKYKPLKIKVKAKETTDKKAKK